MMSYNVYDLSKSQIVANLNFRQSMIDAMKQTLLDFSVIMTHSEKIVNKMKLMGLNRNVAEIQLTSPLKGKLGIAAERKLYKQLSFMLNSGNHLSDISFDMILTELLNSAAGKLLNEIIKEDDLFKFGIPYVKSVQTVRSELIKNNDHLLVEFHTYQGVLYFYVLFD